MAVVEAPNYYQETEVTSPVDRIGHFLSPNTFTGKLIWSLGLLSLVGPLWKSHHYIEAILAGGGGAFILTRHTESSATRGRERFG